MADGVPPVVAIQLPADLIAQLEELKKDREDDRAKPVQQLVEELCRSYVRVREAARWERAHQEELNRSYREQPDDWGDADEWARIHPAGEDNGP